MKRVLTLLAFVLLTASPAPAQGFQAPTVVRDAELKNSIGFGPSAGWVLDNDKWFWGFAVDFGRRVDDRWCAAFSLAYDQEIEDQTAGTPEKKVNTFTGAGTVSYLVTERFSLTTGLGLGILHDDNKEQEYRFDTGDLGTGLVFGYAWPWGNDRSITLSAAYEWNLTEAESTISFDTGIALAF